MITKIVKLDFNNPDENILAEAAGILQNGGLVAFPTETVYGLGANGLSESAAKKIYEAKGRPSDNPLILTIGSLSGLSGIVSQVSESAQKIIDAFWPGPITLVLKKADCVPLGVTGGLDTVAVRFPENKIAQRLICLAGIPIAAPSANASGRPSPTRASHVEFDLAGKIDMIIDGGAAELGLESTIIDVSEDIPMLLRPGAITVDMIETVLGKIEIDKAILGENDKDVVPKAPGMKYTHYSPLAKVILVRGELENVVKKINELSEIDAEKGIKVGIMATSQSAAYYNEGRVLVIGDRDDPQSIAANLFKMLRKFDFLGMDKVYAEVYSTEGFGAAIMNRLEKAAGYTYIDA